MKPLVEKTGGSLVFNDTYMSDVFRKSLVKIFTQPQEGDEGELSPSLENNAYNCQIKVLLSKNIKLCGCIGNCYAYKENANKN